MSAFVQSNLSAEKICFIEQSPDVLQRVQELINIESATEQAYLQESFPFSQSEAVLKAVEEGIDSEACDLESLILSKSSYLAFLKQAGLPMDADYWQSEITAIEKIEIQHERSKALELLNRHLTSVWRKQFDGQRILWEIDTISKMRQKFLITIESWLEQLQLLSESLKSLGFELGRFFDLSDGDLSPSDIGQITRWAEYLRDDNGVKELCDLLGRLQQLQWSQRIDKIREVTYLKTTVPDMHSREEVVGIKLGNDMENVLPSELSLLSDPDTEVLFDLKFIESRLMCFEKQGWQDKKTFAEQEVELTVNDEGETGPMIICIDTSGSMHGTPETIAKSVSLFIASRAKEQGRDCCLINFSTSIDVLDLSGEYSFQTLLQFLSNSFHGGTDITPAIMHGIEMMKNAEFKNADMLVISDFVMGQLPTDILDKIEAQRLVGSKFYSLCIGNLFMSNRLETYFDREWIFAPENMSLIELDRFQRSVVTQPCRAYD